MPVEAAIWWGHRARYSSYRKQGEKFQKTQVIPKARQLAQNLLQSLTEQLERLNMAKITTSASPDAFWDMQVDILQEAFESALNLRGLMLSSIDEYELQWPVAGTPFNRLEMEAVDVREDPREVTICVSPRLIMKANEDWPETQCWKAKVLTRTPRGSGASAAKDM